MMIKNRVKKAFGEKRPVLNAWCSIANPFISEILAAQGYDSITVDMQHGVVDYTDAVRMFQTMRASNTTPMARVPWLEPGIIMKSLDAGAYGIICPMINNRAQAEELVSYIRYPPKGTRSFGPTRALYGAGDNYYKEANENVTCFAMIETGEAYSNLREIVTTPGLDGVYIGPADLTLGVTNGKLPPGLDRQEPEMIECIKNVMFACKDEGIIAGIHTGSSEYAIKAIEWGFDLVTLLSDVRLLSGAAKQNISEVKKGLNLITQSETDDQTSSY
ncbi:MAG: aldolase/citrate lyase family protein [Rhodobacteraceae bacterium]|nr:aldolase/citrate lyase family protein [Paracoccaceae bacterium]